MSGDLRIKDPCPVCGMGLEWCNGKHEQPASDLPSAPSSDVLREFPDGATITVDSASDMTHGWAVHMKFAKNDPEGFPVRSRYESHATYESYVSQLAAAGAALGYLIERGFAPSEVEIEGVQICNLATSALERVRELEEAIKAADANRDIDWGGAGAEKLKALLAQPSLGGTER